MAKKHLRDSSRKLCPFPIVGIGASAGGLEALTSLLNALPPDTGLAFVIVQHLDPKHESLLPSLLARSTKMPVRQVTEGMRVEANQVFVIPPNTSLAIEQGVLRLAPREAIVAARLPIDGLLRSLAECGGNKSIAVILSGTGADGALGLTAVKAEGGTTFAQDEKSAKFSDMPKHAVATGCVDFVLSPRDIGRELARIASHKYFARSQVLAIEKSPGAADEDFSPLFTLMQHETGIDFGVYRQTTVRRRVHRRQMLRNMETVEAYTKYLRKNPTEVAALYQDLLLKVTQFFRQPEAFEALTNRVFPELLRNRPDKTPIRIWVTGCASGEEAYTLAICLTEFLEEVKSNIPIQLFATDINASVIERARRGICPENIRVDVSARRLQRYFTQVEHGYRVNQNIRDRCVFATHDLIKDPPYSRLDLITCRNVLIYLGSVVHTIIPSFTMP